MRGAIGMHHRAFIGLDAPCPEQFLIRPFVSFGEILGGNVMDRPADDILHFSTQKVPEGLIASKIDTPNVFVKYRDRNRVDQLLEEYRSFGFFVAYVIWSWFLDYLAFFHSKNELIDSSKPVSFDATG